MKFYLVCMFLYIIFNEDNVAHLITSYTIGSPFISCTSFLFL